MTLTGTQDAARIGAARDTRSLDRALGDDWQLLLITDGTEQQLQPLTSQWRCITTNDLAPGDCSDVLALANRFAARERPGPGVPKVEIKKRRERVGLFQQDAPDQFLQ